MSYQDDLNNAKSLFDSGALNSEEYNKLKESILKKQIDGLAQPAPGPEPAYRQPDDQQPDGRQADGQQQDSQQPSYQQQDYQQPSYQQQDSQQPNYQQQDYRQQDYQQQDYRQQNYQQGGPQYYQQPPYAPNQKSKIAAGLLGIFLGCLGVHNFYLGYTGKAIAQLILTLALGWAFGIGIIIAGIWGLVEGIMILAGGISTDAKGVPLRD
jgi:TM2 domain-containing membrane protein YozV